MTTYTEEGTAMDFNRDMSLEMGALCSLLIQRVKEYFQDPEHRKEFEEWYKEEYGKNYEWRNKFDHQANHRSA